MCTWMDLRQELHRLLWQELSKAKPPKMLGTNICKKMEHLQGGGRNSACQLYSAKQRRKPFLCFKVAPSTCLKAKSTSPSQSRINLKHSQQRKEAILITIQGKQKWRKQLCEHSLTRQASAPEPSCPARSSVRSTHTISSRNGGCVFLWSWRFSSLTMHEVTAATLKSPRRSTCTKKVYKSAQPLYTA